MNQASTPEELATAETSLRDLLAASLVMPVVLVAHEIGVFEKYSSGLSTCRGLAVGALAVLRF